MMVLSICYARYKTRYELFLGGQNSLKNVLSSTLIKGLTIDDRPQNLNQPDPF